VLHGRNFAALLPEGMEFLMFVRLQGGGVPEPDGRVPAGGGEATAVRTGRHAQAHVGVPTEAEHLPPGRRLPDARRLTFAHRGEAQAVGAEGDAVNASVMAAEGGRGQVGRRVPEFERPVEAGRGEPAAVRTERDRGHTSKMSGKGAEVLPGLRVPYHHAA